MKIKQIISLLIIISLMIFFNYQLYKDYQIVNFLNSFSRSTQCEIIWSSGVEIIIKETECENIRKEGVSFFIDDNGRKTYKGQEMVDLMEVKLCEYSPT
jgi:hypothetical protein